MIRCTQQYNIKCFKCGNLVFDIVRIGVLYMCPDCFIQEFGISTTKFEIDSKLGEVYSKWLKKYKEAHIV